MVRDFLVYTRELGYDQDPDYAFLTGLIQKVYLPTRPKFMFECLSPLPSFVDTSCMHALERGCVPGKMWRQFTLGEWLMGDCCFWSSQAYKAETGKDEMDRTKYEWVEFKRQERQEADEKAAKTAVQAGKKM